MTSRLKEHSKREKIKAQKEKKDLLFIKKYSNNRQGHDQGTIKRRKKKEEKREGENKKEKRG